jgi:signal transduction histidine kinase
MIGGFWSAMLALLLAWTVGRSGSGRAWGTLAVFAVVRVIHTHLYAPGNEPVEIAFFAMGALAGYLWAERERVERSALAEVNSIDANTSAVVEAAVREERRRVARELHDVTSHAVGVMVVQAGAALTLAGSDPLAADQAVAEIDRAGAQALAELTTLSRILARDPATESGVEPADSDELMALIERMAAGGLRITHALAEVRNDEVGIARTTYRVIQEALTNALRHARYSAVHVSTARDEAGLDITVTNDRPPATGGPPAQESGFGLIGLTERVRSLGGTMSAGPSPTGGFAVRVHLPLTRPEPLMAER